MTMKDEDGKGGECQSGDAEQLLLCNGLMDVDEE